MYYKATEYNNNEHHGSLWIKNSKLKLLLQVNFQTQEACNSVNYSYCMHNK